MKPVQVGTVLMDNEDTAAIYEAFTKFFDLRKECDCCSEYVLKSEPNEKLVQAIEKYYAKVKRQNQKREDFITQTAEAVYKGLTKQAKEYIFEHPDSDSNHFGLGLYIRNNYIHGHCVDWNPDSLSAQIVAKIASFIIEDYDYENLFYRYLYDSFRFCHLRRVYRAIVGKYPDDILAEFADLPDDLAASRAAEDSVEAVVVNKDRFLTLSKKYGLTDKQIEIQQQFVDEYNSSELNVIPYELALVASNKMDTNERERWLNVLREVLKEEARLAMELPAFIFNQKDAVLLAVSALGTSLKRFKRFNGDDDVIRAALSNDGEAIQYVNKNKRDMMCYVTLALQCKNGNPLKMRCMVPYRDREELVRIALEANGCNIQWASSHLKDDFETAAFAIRHQKDWYPESTVCNLSKRLRDNMELAIIDIQEGHACVEDYSLRLRNSDEIAEALLASEYRWKLCEMSERIQNKYGQNDV